jgi:hypothetical protein
VPLLELLWPWVLWEGLSYEDYFLALLISNRNPQAIFFVKYLALLQPGGEQAMHFGIMLFLQNVLIFLGYSFPQFFVSIIYSGIGL